MDDTKQPSRRRFIKLASATTIIAGATSHKVFGSTNSFTIELQQPASAQTISPNDKIQVATIGIGGQGTGNTQQALKVPGVVLVAVADVYDGRLTRAQEVFGTASSQTNVAATSTGATTVSTSKTPIFTTRDYREILARPDVDAVIIATPDHWHAQMAIDALAAGKDVYLEKPMIHNIDEGEKVIKAERKSQKILQIGSQRVSSIVYRKAKELIASGAIGQLILVEAHWNRNTALGAWQYSLPPDASPQTVDWDRFLGDAPKRPFEPTRLFRWRNYTDYGTGVAGDLFVHLFSGIHYVLDTNGPERIMATGGLRHWNDGRDAPDVMLGLYDYPKTATHPAFNLALKVNFMDGGGGEEGFRFVGTSGVMTIGWGGITLIRSAKELEPGHSIETFPKAVQEQFLKEYRVKYPEGAPRLNARQQESYAPPSGYSDHLDHFKNFFAAVRSRQPVVEDGTFGFRAAGPALLSNSSHFERRAYKWDAERMKAKAD
jgi:predicted dehydrogenase